MNESQFEEIIKKLNLLIKLLATDIIQDKDYREQVMLLHNIGLQPKEIAEITGKSTNNVNVTLHLIKKSKKRRVKKGGK